MIPDKAEPGDLISVNGQHCEITFIYVGRTSVQIRYPDGKTTRFWPTGHINIIHRDLAELNVLPCRRPPGPDAAVRAHPGGTA